MRKGALILLFAGLLLAGPIVTSGRTTSWSGVDETVIGKFAEEAGRPAQEPLLNTSHGDLLLFVFLLAGAAGGFAAGYWFRILFPPGQKKSARAAPPEEPKDNGRGALPDKDFEP